MNPRMNWNLVLLLAELAVAWEVTQQPWASQLMERKADQTLEGQTLEVQPVLVELVVVTEE